MARLNSLETSINRPYTWYRKGGNHIALVIANFNRHYTQELERGADAFLNKVNFSQKHVLRVRVPGALELPWMCQHVIGKHKVQGVVAMGVVIKGDTYHFEMVCQGVTSGLLQVSLGTRVPIMQAVLTCYKEKQVKERCRGEKNKGYEAMQALFDSLESANAC